MQLASQLGHMEMLPNGEVMPAAPTTEADAAQAHMPAANAALDGPAFRQDRLETCPPDIAPEPDDAAPAGHSRGALFNRLLTRNRTRAPVSRAHSDAGGLPSLQRSMFHSESGFAAEPGASGRQEAAKQAAPQRHISWFGGSNLSNEHGQRLSDHHHNSADHNAAAPVAEAAEGAPDAAPRQSIAFGMVGNMLRAWRPGPAAPQVIPENVPQPDGAPAAQHAAAAAQHKPSAWHGKAAAQLIAVTNMTRQAAHAHQPTTSERYSLSLKLMCGAGSMCIYHCGGSIGAAEGTRRSDQLERWEYFLGDSAFAPERDAAGRRQSIAQIAAIEDHAQPGDIIISQEMLTCLKALRADAEVLSNGAVRLQQLHTGEEERELLRIGASGEQEQLPSHVAARAAPLFRMHVVDNVRQRLEAGHFDFINEIRQLTVLFMGFPTLKQFDAAHAHDLEPVQQTVLAVSHVVHELGGSFVQFRCDEKGFLAICAFGLPGVTHVNDPERGILAALRMQSEIQAMGHTFACGVTTGALLCACVGSKARSEYTMFGDAINLSARLMCKAKTGQLAPIITDEPTFEKAKTKAEYGALPPMPLKGKEQPAKVCIVLVLPCEYGSHNCIRA